VGRTILSFVHTVIFAKFQSKEKTAHFFSSLCAYRKSDPILQIISKEIAGRCFENNACHDWGERQRYRKNLVTVSNLTKQERRR
jgi:hypothetical protein